MGVQVQVGGEGRETKEAKHGTDSYSGTGSPADQELSQDGNILIPIEGVNFQCGNRPTLLRTIKANRG